MRAFVLSCFVFLLVACSEREQYEDYINRQLFTHYTETDLEKYDFIVVIPRRGCHACIRTAESFFEGSKNNPKFLFIFLQRLIHLRNYGWSWEKKTLSGKM